MEADNDSTRNDGRKGDVTQRLVVEGNSEGVALENTICLRKVVQEIVKVSGEFSSASPEHLSMASPESGVGKHVHPFPYVPKSNQNSREFGSPGFGIVAWKERVEGWKVKPEKNVVPMSTSHAASEGRGGGDIETTNS